MSDPEQTGPAVTRRHMLIAGAACFAAAFGSKAIAAVDAAEDPLQRTLKQRAVRIHAQSTVAELRSVLDAIGDARIVLLGEPSHGAGTAFCAKSRLVQLLHEHLGFDVLAWESGLIDLERTEAALSSDADPVAAAQLGILKIWSASAQCRPLFEYAKASHATRRPLRMAGFDMQLTSDGALEYFARELRQYLSEIDSPRLREEARICGELFLTHFQSINAYTDAVVARLAQLTDAGINAAAVGAQMAAWEKATGAVLRPKQADLAAVQESAATLLGVLGEISGKEDTGTRTGFMGRAITGLAAYGANLLESQGQHSADDDAAFAMRSENRRDRVNAENLRWLIDKAYAAGKLIVWAHSAHVMKAWYGPGFDSVSPGPVAGGMKPSGAWLADWYGSRAYSIGFTAYQGADATVGSAPMPIPPAAVGSLEERLHRLGAPEALVPLHAKGAKSVTCGEAVSMRVPKYNFEMLTDPAIPYDGLYYLDTMEPARSR